MKKIFVFMSLITAFAVCAVSCTPAPAPAPVENTQEQTEEAKNEVSTEVDTGEFAENETSGAEYENEFMQNEIQAIVEQAQKGTLADYLKDTFAAAGGTVTEDGNGNIIIDMPATEGNEGKEKVILQSSINIPKDCKFEKDGAYIKSSGTPINSINAGGTALAVYAATQCAKRGEIRIILTTTAEDGTLTAGALTPEILNCEKIINLNYYNTYAISNFGNGCNFYTISRELETKPSELDTGVKISVNGLLGGYSYNTINSGRANAVKLMGSLLYYVKSKNIPFEIASVTGGSGANVLPAECTAYINISSENMQALTDAINEKSASFAEIYGSVETGLSTASEQTEAPAGTVLEDTCKNSLISILNALDSGVYSMSQSAYGYVESYINLGSVSTEGGISLSYCIEAPTETFIDEIENSQETLEALTGFTAQVTPNRLPWLQKKDSALTQTAQTVYQTQEGYELYILPYVAKTEVFQIYGIVPNADIISIGCDVENPGTDMETLDTTTLQYPCNLLSGILSGM